LALASGPPAGSAQPKTVTVSTESIASPSLPADVADSCAGCGAPLADDQRYCLQCGERRTPMSSVLLAGPPARAAAPGAAAPGPVPPGPVTRGAGVAGGAQRGSAVTVFAGVGVLLLAMGVGVLIGRSGTSKSSLAPSEVITVSAPSAGGAAAAVPAERSFTDDWPSGTTGYTVQLQALPQASTALSAVEAAKAAATGKGAKGVGALKSSDFSGLAAGNYVIYAGVYKKRPEAEKALKGLRSSFPGASVMAVSPRASSSSAASGSSGSSSVGSSASHPAPPSAVESLKSTKGKTYEERSKALPNVMTTG
jgi:hypothetical protein